MKKQVIVGLPYVEATKRLARVRKLIEQAISESRTKRYQISVEPLLSPPLFITIVLLAVVIWAGWPNPNVWLPTVMAFVSLVITIYLTDYEARDDRKWHGLCLMQDWLNEVPYSLSLRKRNATVVTNLNKTYLAIEDGPDRLLVEEFRGEVIDIDCLVLKGCKTFVADYSFDQESNCYAMLLRFDLTDNQTRIGGEYEIWVSADCQDSIVPVLLEQDWMYASSGDVTNLDDAISTRLKLRFDILFDSQPWQSATRVESSAMSAQLFANLNDALMNETANVVGVSLLTHSMSYTIMPLKT